MQKLALKYGTIGSIVLITGVMIPFWIWGNTFDLEWGEVAGYASMILSMTAIYFGIKAYKNELEEALTFKKAFIFGLFVDFIAALVFGIFSFVLYKWIAPDFMEVYYEHSLEQIRTNNELTTVEIQNQLRELEGSKALMLSPGFGGLLMFITVFPIGLVMTVISSFVLRDK